MKSTFSHHIHTMDLEDDTTSEIDKRLGQVDDVDYISVGEEKKDSSHPSPSDQQHPYGPARSFQVHPIPIVDQSLTTPDF